MGVIVAGMHRSGTSVMTGALHRLGLRVGAEHELIGASRFNRTGHFEVKDLVIFNEMLLQHLDATWARPPRLDCALQLAELGRGAWGDRAREHFARWRPDGPWVLKDPRFSIVLPFWREVIDEPVEIVIMVRTPTAVAASLERRSNLSIEHGLALWERYNQAALRNSDGLPTFLTHYERFANDPAGTLCRLVVELGQDDQPEAANVADAAAIVDVRHHAPVRLADDSNGSDEARDLYRVLAGLDGWLFPGFVAKLPLETRGLDDVLDP